jgi:hypothetical protein
MVKACEEYAIPTQNSMLKPVVEPNDFTYSGRKGKILENPTDVINCAKNMMYSVRCQGVEKACFKEANFITGVLCQKNGTVTKL